MSASSLDDQAHGSISETVAIPCGDDVLSGQVISAAQDRNPPQTAIILHPATGVPSDFYIHFARWLAQEKAAHVLLYDYRDSGRNVPRRQIRSSQMTMSRWGLEDQNAALTFLCDRYPNASIWVVGHSLGGFFMPWHDQATRVTRFIAIASGPAHLSHHPLYFMPAALWMWYGAGPALTAMMGYLPGRRLGLGSDLPGGVFWQWRRWCLNRDWWGSDLGTSMPPLDRARVTADMRLVALSDDPMIPPPTVRELGRLYTHSRIEYDVISPAEIGTRSIGHIGVFRRRSSRAWTRLVAG